MSGISFVVRASVSSSASLSLSESAVLTRGKDPTGTTAVEDVVVHNSDHNCVMVAIVDYYIRANHSITGKGNHRVHTKVVSL